MQARRACRLEPQNRVTFPAFEVQRAAWPPYPLALPARGGDWFRRTALDLFGELCFPLGRFVVLKACAELAASGVYLQRRVNGEAFSDFE